MLSQSSTWRDCKASIRIISVVASDSQIEKKEKSLNLFLEHIRMIAKVKVVTLKNEFNLVLLFYI